MKNRKLEIFLCVVIWTVIIGLVVGVNVKHHELTDEEIAAAETTRRLKEAAQETTTEETTTEEVTDATTDCSTDDSWSDYSDRYMQAAETVEVYEDYRQEEETEVYTTEATAGAYTFTEDEIWEMTRIVYLENGIVAESTDETLYLTACVILNRLYDWDECNTVYEVIWEPGQYSTADRYTDYGGGELGSYTEGWSRSYAAVCAAIENTDRNPHFQSMSVQGEVYYIDPNTGEVFCY